MSDERIEAGATRGERDPKHTPGPWESPDKDGWIAAGLEDVVSYAGCGTHKAEWENPADLRLALAAPDLLAALKDLVLDIESTDFAEVEVYQPGIDLLKAANAAISKAEAKP